MPLPKRKFRPTPGSFWRDWLRWQIGGWGAAVSCAFHPTPPGRWFHRRVRAAFDFNDYEVRLEQAGSIDLTIAFLSDMHAGHYLTADDLEGIARDVQGREPDLIVLGGDMINHIPEQIELYDRALAHMRPPLGVFAVPGNHEYYEGLDPGGWRAWLGERGVRVLWNQGQRIERPDWGGASLWLAGVDELEEGAVDIGAALEGRRADEPTVLVAHHPDTFMEAVRHPVDLQLSGHTHGGQIRLFGWAPLCHSRHGFLGGFYRRESSRLFVGSGVGVSALPLRIGTRGEVAFLRLLSRGS